MTVRLVLQVPVYVSDEDAADIVRAAREWREDVRRNPEVVAESRNANWLAPMMRALDVLAGDDSPDAIARAVVGETMCEIIREELPQYVDFVRIGALKYFDGEWRQPPPEGAKVVVLHKAPRKLQ